MPNCFWAQTFGLGVSEELKQLTGAGLRSQLKRLAAARPPVQVLPDARVRGMFSRGIPLLPGQRSCIQIAFVCRYWSCAAMPLSRPPKPDCLYPPNGTPMSPSEKQLTETVPALIARATL